MNTLATPAYTIMIAPVSVVEQTPMANLPRDLRTCALQLLMFRCQFITETTKPRSTA